jgi:hypothetical protein
VKETQMRKALYGGSDVPRSSLNKRKKMNPRKRAKRYADDCCRQYARDRWKACVTCGSTEHLEWAHLLTSVAESTRWNLWNFAVQCRSCNLRHEYDPSPMTLWFLKMYGAPAYESLSALHHSPAHYKEADLKAIGDGYKRLLEKLHDPDWMKEPL